MASDAIAGQPIGSTTRRKIGQLAGAVDPGRLDEVTRDAR